MNDEQETQGLQDDDAKILEEAMKEAATSTPALTPAELVQLRILQKNPPSILAESQLLGIRQRKSSHVLSGG